MILMHAPIWETKASVWTDPQRNITQTLFFPAAQSPQRDAWVLNQRLNQKGIFRAFVCNEMSTKSTQSLTNTQLFEKELEVGRAEWRMGWQYSGMFSPVLISQGASVFWKVPTNTGDIAPLGIWLSRGSLFLIRPKYWRPLQT